MVRPRFTTGFSGAVIRKGADELTLRAHEEGVLRAFIDTPSVGDRRCGPPLVDADWHAFCHAIFQGIEGSEWDPLHYRYKDLQQTVKSKKSKENKKANVS